MTDSVQMSRIVFIVVLILFVINGRLRLSDELLLLEIERLRQMLKIASVDISKFINCKPSDYLHDLGTRDYYKEIKEK